MNPEQLWRRRVFRIVLSLWLIGWYCKAFFFAPYLLSTAFAHPVRHAGLTAALSSPWLSAALWLAPLSCLVSLAAPGQWAQRLASLVCVVSASGLAVHLNTFNDATFVTSLWVGLWLCWLAFRPEGNLPSTLRHARTLAQCVVGLMFLGGFTGKLTAGYWTGEALYHLYGLQKAAPPWPWLRSWLSPEELQVFCRWFSRGTVGLEGLLSLAPLVPYRWLAIAGTSVMTVMVVFSTVNLFSVFACLIGLVLALARDPDASD